MPVTTRGDKPSALDAPLWGNASANITKPITSLINAGYATQSQPGSANWNWLTNYVSAGVTHCFIYGTPIWDTDEIYVANSYTNRNGIIFKSRVGANTGNVPESSPTEWQDTRSPLPVAISASGTHTPQAEFNEQLNIDTSGGDIALIVDPAIFSNQMVKIISTGGNITTLTVSGHTGTITLGDQTVILLWNGSGYFVEQSVVSKKLVSASGAVVFGPVSFEYEVDLSGGNISISILPVPDFIGQRVHVYGVGSGIGDIAGGTGLYVNGVFFTENTGGVYLTAISLTEYRVDNGVTADYVSGNYRVEQMSLGRITQSRVYAFATDGVNSNFTLVSAIPVALNDFTKSIFTSSGSSSFFGASGTGGYMSFITLMTSSTSLTVGAKTASVPNIGTTTTATISVEEKY